MGVPFRTLGKRTGVFILVIGGGAALYWLFVQTRLHQIHEFNNRERGHAKLVMDAVGSVTDNANHWHDAKDVCRFRKEQPYLVGGRGAGVPTYRALRIRRSRIRQ